MKKVLLFVVSVMLMLSMIVTASAAPAISLNAAKDQVAVGETVSVVLSFKGVEAASAAYVTVSVSDSLELVSGKWLKDGTITDFTGNSGVIAFGSAIALEGSALELTVKGLTASTAKSTVKASVRLVNGPEAVLSTSASAKVQVICAAHTFGEWAVETAATCEGEGKETRVCSVCEVKDEQAIAALGHKYGKYKVTQEATCDKKGVETRTCSVCKGKDTRKVKGSEHTFGEPVVVTAATETSVGKQTKTCTACATVVEEEIPMLPATQPTEPTPTEPVETQPVETQPVETQPVETEPVETEPVETQPVATEPAPVVDNEGGNFTIILVGVLAVLAIILIIILVLKKKKQN